MSYMNYVCKKYKVQILVDDPKLSTQEPDVQVVDIAKFNMYLMCKILGCWFWVEYLLSTIYLSSVEFWIEGAEIALMWQGSFTQVKGMHIHFCRFWNKQSMEARVVSIFWSIWIWTFISSAKWTWRASGFIVKVILTNGWWPVYMRISDQPCVNIVPVFTEWDRKSTSEQFFTKRIIKNGRCDDDVVI